MENAKSDFKNTIDRIAEASRWKKGTIDDWVSRGEVVCAGLMEEAKEVLKKAEAREEAEARIRIMESQCEELAELVEQAGKQIPAEAEAELLIDLEEEIGQRKEMVGALGRALKETVTGGAQGQSGGGHPGVGHDGEEGQTIRGPHEDPAGVHQQGLRVG
jgi:vacuolar-type H+-ATPase subunit I/STV1